MQKQFKILRDAVEIHFICSLQTADLLQMSGVARKLIKYLVASHRRFKATKRYEIATTFKTKATVRVSF